MKKRSTSVSTGRGSRSGSMGRRQTRPASRRSATASSHRRSSSRAGARSGGSGRTQKRSRSSAQLTTDHDEIRRWAEERGGHPATVAATTRDSQPAGLIRIDFPGYSGKKSLKRITWNAFFKVFDERELALLHQDKTANGKPSRFNKLVAREK